MESYRISNVIGEGLCRAVLTDLGRTLRIAQTLARRRGEPIEVWRRAQPGVPFDRIALYAQDGRPIRSDPP